MDDRLLVSSFLNRRGFALGLLSPLLLAQKDKEAAKPTPVVYTPGGDVKPPKVTHYVEPAFVDTSSQAFVDGVVTLKTTVTPEGLAEDIQVTKGLNEQEDKNAVEAVKKWRFQPGTKGGEPVRVRISIQIAFHLM